MSTYPRTLADTEISAELAALVRDLARRILTGDTPQHFVLRRQLKLARLDRITFTGSGLFAHFQHDPGSEAIAPPDFTGGDVPIHVRTLDAPAGCLFKVTGGLLDFLEIHTYGDVSWPDRAEVTSFGEVTPLTIPAPEAYWPT